MVTDPSSHIPSTMYAHVAGDRIFHQSAGIMTGQKLMQRDVPDYKNKIAKVLSEGASGGRVTKCLQ